MKNLYSERQTEKENKKQKDRTKKRGRERKKYNCKKESIFDPIR